MANNITQSSRQNQQTEMILRIALSIPLRAFFDYLPPAETDLNALQPGLRVKVPFGKSQRVGIIVEITAQSEISPKLLKPVQEVLDSQPWLKPRDMAFMHWAASYYQHPVGEVIVAALPVHLRKGEAALSLTETAYQLAVGVTAESLAGNAVRQKQIVNYLLEQQRAVFHSEMLERFEQPTAVLKSLLKNGMMTSADIEISPRVNQATLPAPSLNDQQRQAVDGVLASEGFAVSLIHGITGSGKTEVYLAIVKAVLQQQKQVMILVPEIALTPQLLERFQQRIGEAMVILHSGLTDRQRCLAWQQAATGLARVVVGTRSAVFTPMPELGLIVIDEEHDASFKQQEGFRYSARDMAVARAQQQKFPVVLGSATPAFETLQNVHRKTYRLFKLTQRAAGASLPKMELIDVRSVKMDAGVSPVTRRLIGEELALGNQVMIFLNRRGFAPVMSCHDCGWVGQCHRCDANLTLHAGKHKLVCHHCGYQQRQPDKCPECSSEKLFNLGQGTERVEQALQKWYADSPCVRIDHDTTRRKGSLQDKLEQVRSGESQILIGTQMLAKGHDFPNVTLVVMLDIDHGLFGTDFRAGERMAQQVLQVAGRAGRAEKSGRVLIQTHHPDHPLLQLLIHKGYDAFAETAMAERKAAAFPPFSYQALIRAEAIYADQPERFLRQARDLALQSAMAPELWGPVPAVMQRKAGQHRFHLLLQTASRKKLHEFLDIWLEQIAQLPDAKKVRWSIDIDPQDFYT